jgi:hypothetical protein
MVEPVCPVQETSGSTQQQLGIVTVFASIYYFLVGHKLAARPSTPGYKRVDGATIGAAIAADSTSWHFVRPTEGITNSRSQKSA